MTIRQQGGIFGRNPTFNDLTAGSGSSIQGSGGNVTFSVDRTDASTSGALVLRAASGTLSIDSNGADKDILIRTGGGTERARFYGDNGNFSIKGNLVVDDGQGIDFSATSGTGTSELFSDYEQGSWNPTFTTSGTDFDSITYDGVTGGLYTKIGNLVHIQGVLQTDALIVGSASGNLFVDGLPYTVAADTGSTQNARAALSVTGVSSFATNNPSGATTQQASTQVKLWYKTSANGENVVVTFSEMNTGSNKNVIRIAGCYIAA